jgi:hypothetical protein
MANIRICRSYASCRAATWIVVSRPNTSSSASILQPSEPPSFHDAYAVAQQLSRPVPSPLHSVVRGTRGRSPPVPRSIPLPSPPLPASHTLSDRISRLNLPELPILLVLLRQMVAQAWRRPVFKTWFLVVSWVEAHRRVRPVSLTLK